MTDQSRCLFSGSWKAAAEAVPSEDDDHPGECDRTFAALPWLGLHYTSEVA
ncbi:hypothetical protein J2S97_003777 [Arthrobacter oryzae]|nr:hypothetical protein [Arthrobacter oryzae]